MTTDPRRQSATAALDHGNQLFAGPGWRNSRAEYEHAHRLFYELGDTAGIADTLCNLASVAWRMTDLDEAERRYEQARDLYLDISAWWHVAKVEQYLGNVAYDRGDLHRARWLYDRARDALRDSGDPIDVADIDVNLAGLLTDLGDHTRALELLDEAEHLYRSQLTSDDLTVKQAEIDQNRGLTFMQRGDLTHAWHYLARAVRTQRRLGDLETVADLLHNLANAAALLRRSATARMLYQHAIAIYDDFGDRYSAADCHLGLGALLWRDGELDEARTHLDTAAAAYTATREWLALAHARHNLALLHPEESPHRARALVAPWLALQSITWGLPEISGRAHWRHAVDEATAAILDAALTSGNTLLAAEIIEALRSAPLAPTAPIPAGISATGRAVHDLPLVRPPAVGCGWPPSLPEHLLDAEHIRNIGGTHIRLRVTTAFLSPFLRDTSTDESKS